MEKGRKSDLHKATNEYFSELAQLREYLQENLARGKATGDDVLDYLDFERNKEQHIQDNIVRIRNTRRLFRGDK